MPIELLSPAMTKYNEVRSLKIIISAENQSAK